MSHVARLEVLLCANFLIQAIFGLGLIEIRPNLEKESRLISIRIARIPYAKGCVLLDFQRRDIHIVGSLFAQY